MKRNRAKADLIRSKSILIILKLLTIAKVSINPQIRKTKILPKCQSICWQMNKFYRNSDLISYLKKTQILTFFIQKVARSFQGLESLFQQILQKFVIPA